MGREGMLVLLEDGRQFSEYQRAAATYASSEHTVLALTPEAIEICESTGLCYATPEECFSEAEYYMQKRASEKEIKEMVSALDSNYAAGPSRAEPGFPLEMGRYFYLKLYLLAGALHLRSFVLERAVERFRPGKILTFMPRPDGEESGNVPRERPYAELLLNSPYAGQCRVIEYDRAQDRPSLHEKLRDAAVEALGRFPTLSSYYALRRNGLAAGEKPGRANILILGPLYNWKNVLSHAMLKNRAGLFWMPVEQTGRKFRGRGNPGQVHDCRFLGFDLNRSLRGFFSAVRSTYEELLETHDDVVRAVGRADVVLVSVFTSPGLNHAAHVARDMGKPVIVYQHGEQNLWDNSLFPEATELLYADHYLSFGKGVTDRYLKSVGEGKLKGALSTGSASLDSIPAKDAGAGYILYATGKYHLYATPFISTVGQDTRLYKAQKKILAFLEGQARAGGRRAVFKRNNTARLNELPFEPGRGIEEAPPGETFTSLLPGASLVILDAPATTCLEASATRKPLFVLLDRVKWNEEPERLLKRRAVAAHTPHELIARIEGYLKTGEYGADLDDREFVRAYGTHLDDGQSAKRAAGFMLELLNERGVRRPEVRSRRGGESIA